MAKGKIFDKPAGESQRQWCNQHMSTEGGPLCEVCGTEWPEGTSVILDRFLGLQLVEECCGRLFDVLYQEIGEEFCQAFLEDFAKNPTDAQFSVLKIILKDLPKKLRARAQETTEIAEVAEKIADESSG